MSDVPADLIRLLARLTVEDYLREAEPLSPSISESEQPEAPHDAT